MSTAPAQFGVIGLGLMGENLALNVGDHGYQVALWNHTPEKVDRFLETYGRSRQWIGAKTLEELVEALAAPRLVLLMIKAGAAVDEMLEKLMPLLSPGDVVIDGGNSLFTDTQRRETALRARGIQFIGMGVSGGAEGARFGTDRPGAGSVHTDWRRLIEDSAEPPRRSQET